jgi:hypothetical protein
MRVFPYIAFLVAFGCASHRAPQPTPAAPHTGGPILYQRTGGIAGTDDRVVIWPDGLVQVRGKILTSGEGWLSKEKLAELRALAANLETIESPPPPQQPVPDAYIISLTCDGKTATALDLAPNLPPSFSKLFAAIEAIAGEVVNQPPQPEP